MPLQRSAPICRYHRFCCCWKLTAPRLRRRPQRCHLPPTLPFHALDTATRRRVFGACTPTRWLTRTTDSQWWTSTPRIWTHGPCSPRHAISALLMRTESAPPAASPPSVISSAVVSFSTGPSQASQRTDTHYAHGFTPAGAGVGDHPRARRRPVRAHVLVRRGDSRRARCHRFCPKLSMLADQPARLCTVFAGQARPPAR